MADIVRSVRVRVKELRHLVRIYSLIHSVVEHLSYHRPPWVVSSPGGLPPAPLLSLVWAREVLNPFPFASRYACSLCVQVRRFSGTRSALTSTARFRRATWQLLQPLRELTKAGASVIRGKFYCYVSPICSVNIFHLNFGRYVIVQTSSLHRVPFFPPMD